MRDDFIGGNPLIKYLRYNFPITANDLNGLGLAQNFSEKDVENIIEMSNAENRELLYKIGVAAAEKVKIEHF